MTTCGSGATPEPQSTSDKAADGRSHCLRVIHMQMVATRQYGEMAMRQQRRTLAAQRLRQIGLRRIGEHHVRRAFDTRDQLVYLGFGEALQRRQGQARITAPHIAAITLDHTTLHQQPRAALAELVGLHARADRRCQVLEDTQLLARQRA